MDEFPPNSHKAKESLKPASKSKKKSEAKTEEKIKPVIQGVVVRRKKPLGKRFQETFIVDNSHTVFQHILVEVIVPATKDLISDAITSAVERMLFGDSSNRRRSSHSSRSGPSNYTRYTKAHRSQSTRPPWDNDRKPRTQGRKARTNHTFDEIILETRAEAEQVIERMFDLTESFETATVSDLYDLLGVEANYTDDKWGWYEVNEFEVRRLRNGYLLDVPKPEPLD